VSPVEESLSEACLIATATTGCLSSSMRAASASAFDHAEPLPDVPCSSAAASNGAVHNGCAPSVQNGEAVRRDKPLQPSHGSTTLSTWELSRLLMVAAAVSALVAVACTKRASL